MTNLVTATELADLIEAGAVRVLDVRWKLGRTDGHQEYLAGHIPGAVFVDMENDLSRPGVPAEGRHPFPSTEQVQESARRWGLDDGDRVVVYDDAGGVSAARAWWLLSHGGVDVRVLNGGYTAWKAAAGDIESGSAEYTPGMITLSDVSGDSLTIDEAAAFPEHGVLLDVRAPERFRGDVEPMDPIAGHIPGAVNLPTTAHIDEEGLLRSPDELRANFAAVGIDDSTPVATYCGSGLTAAHTALVLAEAGIDAKIFHGSWSAWSNTPGRPIATGA
jgi:thiosulfate/3-mercaptopyruvate sulfurtransferase